MNNIERLELEVGIENIEIKQYQVYLEENGLDPLAEYEPTSNSNLKAIYQTAMSVLESIANNTNVMKNYKTEDISITHFYTNLMNRIDYLNRKIRMMPNDDDDFGSDGGATIGYLFTE